MTDDQLLRYSRHILLDEPHHAFRLRTIHVGSLFSLHIGKRCEHVGADDILEGVNDGLGEGMGAV